MATIRGGDILNFNWAGRDFDIPSEANIPYRLKGKIPENKVTGGGKKYVLAKTKLAGLDDVPLVIDQERKDLEFLQAHADGNDYPLNITMASGIVYSGDCSAEGDLDSNTGEGQAQQSFRSENFEQI